MGEGELARVLAAVEALTSQVGDISTAVQQQQHCVGFWCHVCLTRVRLTVQELLRTRGSDQLQDADSSRIKVYVRKAGHLPDTMVGE